MDLDDEVGNVRVCVRETGAAGLRSMCVRGIGKEKILPSEHGWIVGYVLTFLFESVRLNEAEFLFE